MGFQVYTVTQNATTGFNEHQYAHAVMSLRTGAIGVGEDHTVRSGRDFATTLIKRGHVRNLFLEGRSSAQGAVDAAVTTVRNSRSSRQLTSSLEHLKAVVDDAGPQYDSSPVYLGDVAVMALWNDVNIHLVDLDRADEVGRLGRYERVAARDIHAATQFSQITAQTGTVGSLVLYGAAHLVGGRQWYRNGAKCLGELLELTSFIAIPEVLPVVPVKRTSLLTGS